MPTSAVKSDPVMDQLNKFYLNNIKSIGSDSITPEDQNIYVLSFFGLLRNGYPYQITEEIPVVQPDEEETPEDPKKKKKEEKKKKKEKKKLHEGEELDDPTINLQPITVFNILIDNRGYKCSEEHLKDSFGVVYDDFIAYKGKKKVKVEEDRPIFMPKWDTGTDDDDIPEFMKNKPEGEQIKVNKKVIPFIKSDPNYPNDLLTSKEYDTFLFDTHNITVSFEDGTKRKYTATVYPLEMDTRDKLVTDVFCVISDSEQRVRPCVSQYDPNGANSSVIAEFEECSFVVRGSWKDGEFDSSVSLYSVQYDKKAYLKDRKSHVKPTKRTSTFYKRYKGKTGEFLDVFPVSLLRNDPQSGLADAYILVEDGSTRRIFSSGEGAYFSLWFDNAQREIAAFWQGNSLILDISD